MSSKKYIRPYLVRHNVNIVTAVYIHSLFYFPFFPHSAGRIVRITKNRRMDIVFFYLFLHILKIHPPHTVAIKVKRTVYNVVPSVFERTGKAHIGRAIKDNIVSP